MPAKKKASTLLISCPRCGHRQREPATAYSSICKSCGQHFRLEDILGGPAQRPAPPASRHIVCFSCGADLEVPASAQSSMCKRCSCHIDLSDYVITTTVSRNFRTKGRFVIQETGYVLNTDTIATDIVLKGRFIGKLRAEQSLEIHTGAAIKGSFSAERLIIPQGQRFRWLETLTIPTTEVAGELVANLHVARSVILRATARFFGNIVAPNLLVESGAVFVGQARIGPIA